MKYFYQIKFLFFISLIFFISASINAQIVYTDITPDYVISQAEYPIDINNDDNEDLSLSYNNYGDQMYQGYETSLLLNEHISTIGYSMSNTWENFASILNHGDTINPNDDWNHFEEIFAHVAIDSKSTGHIGGWDTIGMGYIALRLEKDGDFYYGWLRLYYVNNTWKQLALADYAFNPIPNEKIVAGSQILNKATSVYVTDNSDYMDGRDIKVSFTKAINESVYSEYRIFVAKDGDENAIDLEYMSQLSDEFFYSIPSDFDEFYTVSQNLFENTKSIDGEAIIPKTDYRIHILNVSSDGITSNNVLSNPSSSFEIAGYLQEVYKIEVLDSTNHNTPEDIYISFYDNHHNEEGIEYRIMFAKTEDTTNFSIETAIGLDQNIYSGFPTNQGTNQFSLQENQLDINGMEIQNDSPYIAFILLIAESNTGFYSSMAKTDRKFFLSNPNYLAAGQTWGENIEWHTCDSLFSDYLYWGSTFYSGNQTSSSIDVNRDGVPDFNVFGEQSHSKEINDIIDFSIQGLRENKVMICEHPNHDNWLDLLPKNTQFGDGFTFNNEAILLYANVYLGAWEETIFSYGHIVFFSLANGRTYYIALQLNDSESAQYAWVKIIGNEFIEYGFQDYTNGVNSEINSGQSFKIFPNPSCGFFQIKSIQNSNQKSTVSIINQLGTIVNDLEMNNTELLINTENYPAGLYYIQIYNNDGLRETHKLVIR